MHHRATVFIVLTLGQITQSFAAQDPPAAGDDDSIAQWQRLYEQVALGWNVSLLSSDDDAVRLERQSQSVMHWSSLDDFNGSVFLWMHEGVPQLVGTVFSFSRNVEPPFRQVVSEFHSLSANPLQVAAENGTPAVRLAPGRDLQVLSDVPAPAESPKARRLQMRNLARRFEAHMLRKDERWELRLLPQPIFYADSPAVADEGDERTLLGCGLFAFVGFVTDPEVLLLIEVERTGAGPRWLFQPIRFSSRDLWVRFDDHPVWESLAAESDALPQAQRPYYHDRRTMSLEELAGEAERGDAKN